jgi:hypothetical protein
VGFYIQISRWDTWFRGTLGFPDCKRSERRRETDYYRHPDCQGNPLDAAESRRTSYKRTFDIYSLGVILLEIGGNRSVRGMKKDFLEGDKEIKKAPWPAGGFRDHMVAEAGKLGTRMGQIYSDVVVLCLTGDFKIEPDRELGLAYFLDVALQLDSCKA